MLSLFAYTQTVLLALLTHICAKHKRTTIVERLIDNGKTALLCVNEFMQSIQGRIIDTQCFHSA